MTAFLAFSILCDCRFPKNRGHVYLTLLQKLKQALAGHILAQYGVEIAVALEAAEIGDGRSGSPVCFELAKRLKRAPRNCAGDCDKLAKGGGCFACRGCRRGIFEHISRSRHVLG